MKPLLVAIVGGSGSGKSWLAKKLAACLRGNAVRISMDDFYRDRSHLSPALRARINFDHPRALDWRAFEKVLAELRSGREASVPRYDFGTHTRLSTTRPVKPRSFILVDGLWVLRRRSIRRLFGVSVFLECSKRTRFSRRFARDRQTRGRTTASIREQFRLAVEPMHVRYVMPQARLARIRLKEDFGLKEVRGLAANLSRLAGPAA